MPATVAGEQFVDAARHRPGFVDPFVGDVAGEDVVERAAADRIADHMAGRADPADIFVAADPDLSRYAFDRHDTAPRHLLGEAHRLHAEQAFTHRRVDAVGADDHIGLDL